MVDALKDSSKFEFNILCRVCIRTWCLKSGAEGGIYDFMRLFKGAVFMKFELGDYL